MSTAADRTRRCRALKAAGLIRVSLILDEDALICALQEARLLHPTDSDDKNKIAAATERFVEIAISACNT